MYANTCRLKDVHMLIMAIDDTGAVHVGLPWLYLCTDALIFNAVCVCVCVCVC